ncbi:MAG: hypothetical protein R2704_00585 [Microthrixaceae bacterium]
MRKLNRSGASSFVDPVTLLFHIDEPIQTGVWHVHLGVLADGAHVVGFQKVSNAFDETPSTPALAAATALSFTATRCSNRRGTGKESGWRTPSSSCVERFKRSQSSDTASSSGAPT